jgi:hypothetical protein
MGLNSPKLQGGKQMRLRKTLLGCFGIVVAAGLMGAKTPENPLVEGREPNPVVQQFHLPEPPPFEYPGATGETPPLPETETEEGGFGTVVWDLLMDRLTMPLGNAEVWD